MAYDSGGWIALRAYELDGVTWLLAVNLSHETAKSLKLEMERPVALRGTSLSAPPVKVEGQSVAATLDPLQAVFLQLGAY